MRILILADDVFACREQALLSRIEVGLADEGLRVAHGIPRGAAAYAPGEMISKVVFYPDRIWPFALPAAARKLIRSYEALSPEDDASTIDLVHVFGGAAWGLGVEVARQVGAGLALEIWRAGLVDRARSLAGQLLTVKPRTAAPPRLLFFAPEPSIEKRLIASVRAGTVRCVPWGVYAADEARELLPANHAPSAMVVGTGRDSRAFHAALEGLASACRATPELIIFCDAQAARRAELHRLARKLGILDRLSLIDELEGRRDLVVEGDILIQPEASGEARTVTLDAMAHGMIVVATPDPAVTALSRPDLAHLVPRQDSASWAAAIQRALQDRAASEVMTQSAAAFIRENHRVGRHIRGIHEGYEALLGSRAMAFPTANV